MVLTIKLKGKKRAMEKNPSGASSPFGSEPPHPTKRVKRAEMRQCPVCDEQIPLRLLPKHAELESERVEQIIENIGSSELPYDEMDDEPGPSSRVRRSAIKARKSMTTRNTLDSLEQSTRTIQNIKRHRKQRGTKLKEMIKEDEEGDHIRDPWMKGEDIHCPVCSTIMRGDQDVLDAHVDACLAYEMQRLEETRQRELQHRRAVEEEIWESSEGGNSGTYVGNIRVDEGAGFYTRNDDRGVDDEIDVDGDDQVAFGDAQFSEGDIVPINTEQAVEEDIEVEIMGDNDDEAQLEQMTLRDLIVSGKTTKSTAPGKGEESVKSQLGIITGMAGAEKLDLAILLARERGDNIVLISALENKLKYLESAPVTSLTPLLCRICIDPYTEPTVSIGCWHTCCKECWLRCLGSTKLCPICKRITGAADLRRIYL